MRSVELFTGAGGLAMGVSRAGFHHKAVVEWDSYCCDTIRYNIARRVEPVADWKLYKADIREFDFSCIRGGVDLLAGGPPCQPFSLGGKHGGHRDERNMFPEVIRVVRELKPQAVLIENVKGLLRRSFATYFEYIRLQLTYPEIVAGADEDWKDHLSRLEQHHTGHHWEGLSYRIVTRLLNAADYGVPQRRERVFIVGFRCDTNAEWAFPEPTHSQAALFRDQYGTGEYWERHGVPMRERPCSSCNRKPPTHHTGLQSLLMPWQTVRDAISDLPDPIRDSRARFIANHAANPGARIYQGHTGSPIDEPAKTLKAGDHGVPGGENMIAFGEGSVRYFTVRESARLQTFPDDYFFHGSWTEAMRQLGNAVPVALAEAVAESIREQMDKSNDSSVTMRPEIARN